MIPTDFETAVFIVDCREVAVRGVVTEDQVWDAFAAASPELLAKLRRRGNSTNEIRSMFNLTILPGFVTLLREHGLTVRPA